MFRLAAQARLQAIFNGQREDDAWASATPQVFHDGIVAQHAEEVGWRIAKAIARMRYFRNLTQKRNAVEFPGAAQHALLRLYSG